MSRGAPSFADLSHGRPPAALDDFVQVPSRELAPFVARSAAHAASSSMSSGHFVAGTFRRGHTVEVLPAQTTRRYRMSIWKGLLLGTASALASAVVAVGAQAADLPVKAKAVEYVKICSLYGE